MKSRKEMLADAQRELVMRRNVYKKRVEAGSMKQELADHQIACQESIVETLSQLVVAGEEGGHPCVIWFKRSEDRDGFIDWVLKPERAHKITKAGALSS